MMSSTLAIMNRNARPVTARLTRGVALLALTVAGLSFGQSPAGASAAESCPNAQFRIGASAGLPACRAYEQVSAADKNGGSLLVNPVTNQSATVAGNAMSLDGNHVFYVTETPFSAATQGGFGLDVATRGPGGWTTRDLAPQPAPNKAAGFPNDLPDPVGITPDFSRLVIRTAYPYDPTDPNDGSTRHLYLAGPGSPVWLSPGNGNQDAEFIAMSDDASHVVFHSHAPLTPDDTGAGVYDWHGGQLSLVGVDNAGQPLDTTITVNGTSRDGSRIFFTTPQGGSNPGLWVRVDDKTTKQLAGAGSTFAGATPDGSMVFFTDTSAELYKEDAKTGALTLLSGGIASAAPTVRVSDDGTRVYFVAAALGGGTELYVNDRGTTKLLAAPLPFSEDSTSVFKPGIPCSGWRVTPDGRHLAFTTASALLPEDTDSNADVYGYDLNGGHLSLASAGANGAFDADLGRPHNTCWGDPTNVLTTDGHNLSDDGRFVFFETKEALAPQDTNANWDVYQYDSTTGVTSLLTDGKAPEGSLYVASSASGADIVFTTADALVPQDQDTAWDMYDARVNGGFAVPEPRPGCREDDCQGAGTSPPPVETPASVAFRGVGNASPAARSPKAKVLTKVVRGATFLLRVQVPTKGRIAISGVGTTRASLVAPKAGTYSLRVTLTPGGKRALHRRHKLELKLRVAYQPAGRQTAVTTSRLSVKPAALHAPARKRGGRRSSVSR